MEKIKGYYTGSNLDIESSLNLSINICNRQLHKLIPNMAYFSKCCEREGLTLHPKMFETIAASSDSGVGNASISIESAQKFGITLKRCAKLAIYR